MYVPVQKCPINAIKSTNKISLPVIVQIFAFGELCVIRKNNNNVKKLK